MRLLRALLLAFLGLAPGPAGAQDPWVLTSDIALVSRWPRGGSMQKDHVTADLYRPRVAADRVPAVVIINSSGGVQPQVEHHYARLLAGAGAAALVVDSFRPRGVRRTGDDQSRVFQTQSDADAIAGFRWFAAQPWADPARVAVMGMSRGANAAMNVALEQYRRPLRATDIRFAAHIGLAVGGCNIQPQDARTTGAPIFFMLAELDDGTPAEPCLDYARRIREAGNATVRIAIYPGVYHAFEGTGGIAWLPNDETARACAGRYVQDASRRMFDRATGRPVAFGSERRFLLESCVQRGYTVGGDERVKAQADADLLQFLRDAEVLQDTAARAVVPDCAAIPEGIVRRNCVRARNGWTGDLVALGRAFRYAGGPRRDDALAARLFQLAAMRGNAQAKWELSLMLRQGAGIPRDPGRALQLAREAAEAGDPAAMNIMGVMLRDGIGTQRDDGAATAWFRRAAELRHGYALANLGRFAWDGRGGVARDRAAAVALWQRAAFDNNPLAQLFLAEALERGEGIARDPTAALTLYRAAAEQQRDEPTRRRAQEALARLSR